MIHPVINIQKILTPYDCNTYGFLMVKFNPRASTERLRSSIKGTVYPCVTVRSVEQAVATKDAHIKLKFITPRLEAKCFCP